VVGSSVFAASVNIKDKPIQMFGFIISICDIIVSAIFLISSLKSSRRLSQGLPNDRLARIRQNLMDSANYLLFVVTLIFILLLLLVIGVIFFLYEPIYWQLYSGAMLPIATSLIISYAPWHDRLRDVIYQSPFERILIIFIVVFISLIASVAIRFLLL
jgi:magnesium-transporting ATPase (P-type)